jgi:hypothetical protein
MKSQIKNAIGHENDSKSGVAMRAMHRLLYGPDSL